MALVRTQLTGPGQASKRLGAERSSSIARRTTAGAVTASSRRMAVGVYAARHGIKTSTRPRLNTPGFSSTLPSTRTQVVPTFLPQAPLFHCPRPLRSRPSSFPSRTRPPAPSYQHHGRRLYHPSSPDGPRPGRQDHLCRPRMLRRHSLGLVCQCESCIGEELSQRRLALPNAADPSIHSRPYKASFRGLVDLHSDVQGALPRQEALAAFGTVSEAVAPCRARQTVSGALV